MCSADLINDAEWKNLGKSECNKTTNETIKHKKST